MTHWNVVMVCPPLTITREELDEGLAILDETFRTVLFTGAHTQLTVMCLRTGEEIGREVHGHLDQFLRIEQGTGRLELGPRRGHDRRDA